MAIEEKYDETRLGLQELSFADMDVDTEVTVKRREINRLSTELKSRVAIASAKAFGFRAGTSRPFSPWRTTSRQPGTSVATIGKPAAIASKRAFGKPSVREQNRKTSAAFNRCGTSVL